MSKRLETSDYIHLLSRKGKSLKSNPLRSLDAICKADAEMINLGGGLPQPSAIPIEGITIKLKSGESFDVSSPMVAKGVNYSTTKGILELTDYLIEYQKELHSPHGNWDVCTLAGSKDGINKIMRIFTEPGDTILCAEPLYAGAKATRDQCIWHGIPTDEHGIQTETLRKTLDNWSKDANKPKVLYIVPTGQNPTGSILSYKRRQELLKIASDHNLIIIEDDPYWYVCLGTEQPIESLLSMDTEGRVLRLDSFSKFLAPGLRLGWITGPKFLVDKIELVNQADVIHPSGVSQAIALSILQYWGKEGIAKHSEHIRTLYTAKRDALISACDEYLKGLATWDVPKGGMFVWLNLIGVEDTEELVRKEAVASKVLLMWGSPYMASGRKSSCIRVSYSMASIEDMKEGIKRLASILNERKK